MDVKNAKEAIAMLQDYIVLAEANKKLKTTKIQEELDNLQAEIAEKVKD